MFMKFSTPRSKASRWLLGLSIVAAASGLSMFTNGSIAEIGQLDADLNEEVRMIPIAQQALRRGGMPARSSGGDADAGSGDHAEPHAGKRGGDELETTVFKPDGPGPFPVLVLNHGKSLGNPRDQERARFLVISREFVKRGYAVVVPMRSGFSKSSGTYVERHCDMRANGLIQARDVQNALAYAVRQPWADANRILVAGQSYGGLAAIAFATHDFPGVKGVINFAGGLRTEGCDWSTSLVQAFGDYGGKATVPSLWFYGANDTYFNHALADRLHGAYTRAGGIATLVKFGAFKTDAHAMSGSHDGVRVWWPETEHFLRSIGMPTAEIYQVAAAPAPVDSGFAALDDVAAVPHLHLQGREQYRAFLTKSQPRAFALSPSGAWSWVEDGDDPAARAVANCQKNSKLPCRLYAVDGAVVWSGQS